MPIAAAKKIVLTCIVFISSSGLKIGIFSVLAPRLQEAKTEEPQSVDVAGLASSQGFFHEGSQFDYPAGAEAVLQWVSENRETLAQGGGPPTDVTSLNIPSCDGGTIRGPRIVPLAPTNDGFVDPQDCESTLENPANDVEALLNGFITRTSIPLY